MTAATRVEKTTPARIRSRGAGFGALENRIQMEVVLLADADNFGALADHILLGGPGKLRWSLQRSLFYDTEAADLRRSGMTLAMQRHRGRSVMSLEMRDGVDSVEVAANGEAPQIELFSPAARGLIVHATARRSIKPLFVCQFRRARRVIAFDGVSIEVAFDDGEIRSENRRAPLRELVLALKEGGDVSALFRFGVALTNSSPLRLGVTSKYDRGLALATGESGGAVRAADPDWSADAALDAALGELLKQSLAHFLSNWPALQSADAGEAVHQIRVALRRLRSLLGLLRRAFPSAELEALRAEAKRLADAFGEARDWRVFADMVREGPLTRLPEIPSLPALVSLAEGREQTGHAAGVATLADTATTQFVLNLQTYVAVRGWRNSATQANLRALAEPVIAFAAQALEASFRRLKRRARGFDTLSPEARHEMRIALKQVRYAVDFFGPLFKPVPAVETFSAKASALQDRLGEANDAVVASERLRSLDISADPHLAFAAGAVLGWCERGGLTKERDLRKGWKTLRKAKKFWREDLPEPSADEPGRD